MENHKNQLKAISLFSGAMGLDLGLEAAGIHIIGCVEKDTAAVATIRLNRPGIPVISTDIFDVTGEKILEDFNINKPDIDLVVGGPPCQAFSVIGKRRGLDDKNGHLVFEFIRIVKELKPKAFLMENVRGMLSMSLHRKTKNGLLYDEINKQFNELGYRVDAFVVNSVNYGAPQIRERVFLIGNRLGLKAVFPPPSHSDKPQENQKKWITLGQAIGNGFIDPDSTIMDFSPRKKKYLNHIPPGGNWRCMPIDIQKESMGKSWYLKGGRSAYWRRLSFDYPAPTVVTMPNHAGTSMCHPKEIRALTAGECAKIQTFPPDWKFSGSPSEKYRQIGNAVPVVLGKMAGRAILKMFELQEKSSLKHNGHTIEHIRPHVRTRQYFKAGKVFNASPYINTQNRYSELVNQLELFSA